MRAMTAEDMARAHAARSGACDDYQEVRRLRHQDRPGERHLLRPRGHRVPAAVDRAAATIYGRLRSLLPDGGTPTPEALLPLPDEALRAVRLSRQKLGYMRDLSRKMLDGSINTAGLQGMSNDEIVSELTKIKGVGRWTVEMLLIFRLTRPHVFPAGDLGIVKAVQKAYNLRKTPDVKRRRR
jgi:3-methyladenine DNA glycosylase/8-oxoguanine DNA glycosylase